MRTSVRPACTASSTTYWMAGLSTTGSISLGVALVAGRNRVPSPATGTTALVPVASRVPAPPQTLVADGRGGLLAGHVPAVTSFVLSDVERLVGCPHQRR